MTTSESTVPPAPGVAKTQRIALVTGSTDGLGLHAATRRQLAEVSARLTGFGRAEP